MRKTPKELEAIETFAKVAWQQLTPDERHGCKFGLFPFEVMQAAERSGVDAQAAAVALMKLAETGHTATH